MGGLTFTVTLLCAQIFLFVALQLYDNDDKGV